jgi:hypothetical protein
MLPNQAFLIPLPTRDNFALTHYEADAKLNFEDLRGRLYRQQQHETLTRTQLGAQSSVARATFSAQQRTRLGDNFWWG